VKRQSLLDPFRFVLISLAGWMNQQQFAIDYLREENRGYGSNSVSGEFG